MGMLKVSFELSKDPMAFIDIINAFKIYGTRHVLDHVNLSIEKASLYRLLGIAGRGRRL